MTWNRLGWLARLFGALFVATLLFASPAVAVWAPGPAPGDQSGAADLVMTGTAAGRTSISGALAPSQFDPLNGYPAAPPPGSINHHVDFAGLITADPIPPGPELLLYCIDLLTPTGPGVRYALGSWNASTVPNVGYVARLLNTYYPNTNEPASLASKNDKAAAVQEAIWFFSDKYVLKANEPRRSQVAAIVQNVINLGPLVNPPPPSLSITPSTGDGPANSLIGPFTLTSSTASATVTATGGNLFKDAAGTQPLINPVADGTQIWARRATAGDVNIQATAVATVPSGNVYLATKQVAQKLILARTGTLQTTVKATATAYDVGNLQVVKSVSGLGEPQRRAVSLAARCSDGSSGEIIYPAGVAPTTPLLVEGIRAGSTCTVLELVDGANQLVSVTTTFTPGATVTIPTNSTTTDTTTVNVSNVYAIRTGALRVTKVVTGTLADQRGDVVVDVSCSNGATASFTFPAGVDPEPQTLSNLPAGATCTTTEPTDGADPPTVVVDTTIVPAAPVTILAGETTEVLVSNLYDSGVGSLAVIKDTDGLDELRGPLTIRAECDNGSVGEQTYPVGTTDPPLVLDNLPLGTVCTVSEPDNGASDRVDVTTSYEPGTVVTITAPQPPVAVRILNTYTPKPGTLRVTKAITGPGAAQHGQVVVAVGCEDGQLQVIDLAPGAPGPGIAMLSNIPAGTDCGVAELADGSNSLVTATVSGLPTGRFVITPADDRTIAVTDAFAWNPGSLVVTKVVGGPLAAKRGAFSLMVTCSNGASVTRTYAPGAALAPITIAGLPAFSLCRVVEPVNGSGTGVGTITNGSPLSLTINPGATTTAVVRNTFVEVAVEAANTTNGLARTGANPRPLGWFGFSVLTAGAALLVTSRARRRAWRRS